MKNLILFCALISLFVGCKTKNLLQNQNSIEFSYPKTILPVDTTQLWANDGKMTSDIVLIVCQGGPSKHLTFVEKGRTSYRYIPNYSNYYIAYLHQAQTWNKEMFNYEGDFTLEMAEVEVDNTSEMLYRALQYFKDRDKTVVVIGTSYGAYIIPNYLSTRKSLADKYVIIAGRMDDNEQMLEQHLKGFNGGFEEDGVSYISEDENSDLSEYSVNDIKEYRVKQLLKAAIGKPRYSHLLAQMDLSNILYFYANNDENVGSLSDAEINFLKSKGAKVFETSSGHSKTLYRFIDKLMDGSLEL